MSDSNEVAATEEDSAKHGNSRSGSSDEGQGTDHTSSDTEEILYQEPPDYWSEQTLALIAYTTQPRDSPIASPHRVGNSALTGPSSLATRFDTDIDRDRDTRRKANKGRAVIWEGKQPDIDGPEIPRSALRCYYSVATSKEKLSTVEEHSEVQSHNGTSTDRRWTIYGDGNSLSGTKKEPKEMINVCVKVSGMLPMNLTVPYKHPSIDLDGGDRVSWEDLPLLVVEQIPFSLRQAIIEGSYYLYGPKGRIKQNGWLSTVAPGASLTMHVFDTIKRVRPGLTFTVDNKGITERKASNQNSRIKPQSASVEDYTSDAHSGPATLEGPQTPGSRPPSRRRSGLSRLLTTENGYSSGSFASEPSRLPSALRDSAFSTSVSSQPTEGSLRNRHVNWYPQSPRSQVSKPRPVRPPTPRLMQKPPAPANQRPPPQPAAPPAAPPLPPLHPILSQQVASDQARERSVDQASEREDQPNTFITQTVHTPEYSFNPIVIPPPFPGLNYNYPLNPFVHNYYYREHPSYGRGGLADPRTSTVVGQIGAPKGGYGSPPFFSSHPDINTYPTTLQDRYPPPPRAAQPEREVPTGTFYCYLLVSRLRQPNWHQQPVQLLRVECNSLLMNDYQLFKQLQETYYSQRGYWGRFLLKGVVDVQMAGFTRKQFCPFDSQLERYAKLSYEMLSLSLDSADLSAETPLLRCFMRPDTCRSSADWIKFLSKSPASWPISTEDHHQHGAIRKTPRGMFIPARLVAPSLNSIRSGEGLLIVEGWLFGRIFALSLVGVWISAAVALCWACAKNVGEGFTIGSYILAAETVGMMLLSVVSVLS
ncbi:MAG: hypothetical protein M1840_004229 [Geoglossum simile]|nr:MAG: hypothetical protein M1840_004229 [Geoglossum simile]